MLHHLSGLHWATGRQQDATRLLDASLRLLGQLPPGADLADAYRAKAGRAMTGWHFAEARRWAVRAVDLAERVGRRRPAAFARMIDGTAALYLGDPDADDLMTTSIEQARACGDHHLVAVAWANRADAAIEQHELARATPALEQGIAHADEHEVTSTLAYLQAARSRLLMAAGRWRDAQELAASVVAVTGTGGINVQHARLTLARLAVRRGDDDAATLLALLERDARAIGEIERTGPAVAAHAEHAWLEGSLDRYRQDLDAAYAAARETGEPWLTGELAHWRRRVGDLDRPPPTDPTPYALLFAGRWADAAAAWQERGEPYEQADALAEADDPALLLTALEIVDALGALPLASRIRERLRGFGVRRIPRGPVEATRTNPAGLTNRQVEVLHLVAEGLTNAEIAERLVLSVRTVDHHVSAILQKLGVDSRQAAAQRAAELTR